VSTTNVPNDTFLGGDLTGDGADIAGSLTNVLLAYLPVTTSQALPPVAGDVFTVSLVPGSDDEPNGISGFTGFADSAGAYYPFSSTAGTVTIVPEPTSTAFCLTATMLYASNALWKRWRNRRVGF
jgi:hypothetical protein